MRSSKGALERSSSRLEFRVVTAARALGREKQQVEATAARGCKEKSSSKDVGEESSSSGGRKKKRQQQQGFIEGEAASSLGDEERWRSSKGKKKLGKQQGEARRLEGEIARGTRPPRLVGRAR